MPGCDDDRCTGRTVVSFCCISCAALHAGVSLGTTCAGHRTGEAGTTTQWIKTTVGGCKWKNIYQTYIHIYRLSCLYLVKFDEVHDPEIIFGVILLQSREAVTPDDFTSSVGGACLTHLTRRLDVALQEHYDLTPNTRTECSDSDTLLTPSNVKHIHKTYLTWRQTHRPSVCDLGWTWFNEYHEPMINTYARSEFQYIPRMPLFTISV